ncbi:MAG: hypothetical protein AVDCRST_MAG56-938, partial [uncultured Cytophagales bacterium]
ADPRGAHDFPARRGRPFPGPVRGFPAAHPGVSGLPAPGAVARRRPAGGVLHLQPLGKRGGPGSLPAVGTVPGYVGPHQAAVCRQGAGFFGAAGAGGV